ncbi:hypothetical protein GY45DRAFT_7779 [Cubamyces sp. BRFM 1775]|nr:hypothetical protein GY45DRAFT_7779 [Cubamyces sp. BRFM 1775]
MSHLEPVVVSVLHKFHRNSGNHRAHMYNSPARFTVVWIYRVCTHLSVGVVPLSIRAPLNTIASIHSHMARTRRFSHARLYAPCGHSPYRELAPNPQVATAFKVTSTQRDAPHLSGFWEWPWPPAVEPDISRYTSIPCGELCIAKVWADPHSTAGYLRSRCSVEESGARLDHHRLVP